MSEAAEHIRQWTVKQRINTAMREAHAAWLTIGVAQGMAGWPLSDVGRQFDRAIDEIARLTF